MKPHVFSIFVVITCEGQIGKFMEIPYSPVVNTTCDTVLGKFTGGELMFTAGKNAALGRKLVNLDLHQLGLIYANSAPFN